MEFGITKFEFFNEKVWNTLKVLTEPLKDHMEKYEIDYEIDFVFMILYEKVWNSMKKVENEYMYELKAEDFALWNFKRITALTWKYDDSFVAFTAADLSNTSQDDRLSNSLLETGVHWCISAKHRFNVWCCCTIFRQSESILGRTCY